MKLSWRWPFPVTWRSQAAHAGPGLGTQRSVRLELAHSASGKTALAFGLQWHTIATSGGRADAIKLARTGGASHFVFRGNRVGLGVLPAGAADSARVVPAILVAARRQHVGHVICLLTLGRGEYWLAATANGQPTATDQFLRGLDDAAALARLRELQARVAGAAAVGIYTNLENSGIDGAQWLCAEDLLALPAADTDLLVPVPRKTRAIPKPVLGFVAAAVALLLAQEGWKQRERQRRAQLAAQAQLAQVDPAQAWAAAIASWESSTVAPNGHGLAPVRASLDRLPLDWNGWTLGSASCSAGAITAAAAPSAPPAPTRTWSCRASYARGTTGHFNRSMASALPQGWSVTFQPLNGLELAWTVSAPARALTASSLRNVAYFEVEVASRLQRLLPALAADVAIAFTPVPIAAPRKADGTALAPDARADALRQASLLVKAPLRSLDAVIAADIEADWLQLSLQYDPSTLRGGAKSSALMAEAKGNAYAIK